jgi:thioredoxin 1
MEEIFYDEAAKTGKLVLLDFGAKWCSTCQEVDNILEQAMPNLDHQLLCVKVDVNERSDLAEHFGVLSVPTVILVNPKGEALWRRSGSFKLQELEAALPKTKKINKEALS